MSLDPRATCWTLILDAAVGDVEARARFAEHYAPVLRAYLGARWRGRPLASDVPDAVQEIFVESFKEGGLLDRAQPERPGGFRAFLYGAARKVALRHEEGRGHAQEGRLPTAFDGPEVSDSAELAKVFDRAWAQSMMRQAAERQLQEAKGDAARTQRVEVLRLRFEEGLPVRDIAERLNTATERIHKQYAQAREEFRRALRSTLLFHQEGSQDTLERTATELLEALG